MVAEYPEELCVFTSEVPFIDDGLGRSGGIEILDATSVQAVATHRLVQSRVEDVTLRVVAEKRGRGVVIRLFKTRW